MISGCIKTESLINSPRVIDGHGGHSDVRVPLEQLLDNPIPHPCLVIKHAVQPVRDGVDGELKLGNLQSVILQINAVKQTAAVHFADGVEQVYREPHVSLVA